MAACIPSQLSNGKLCLIFIHACLNSNLSANLAFVVNTKLRLVPCKIGTHFDVYQCSVSF